MRGAAVVAEDGVAEVLVEVGEGPRELFDDDVLVVTPTPSVGAHVMAVTKVVLLVVTVRIIVVGASSAVHVLVMADLGRLVELFPGTTSGTGQLSGFPVVSFPSVNWPAGKEGKFTHL